MGTPFTDVYSLFLQKISDYNLSNLFSTSPSTADSRMYGWMQSAIPKFSACLNDLSSRDTTSGTFASTLTDYEKEILASLMIVEWLKPEVNSILEMRNLLNNSDFKTYSTANLLKEKRENLKFAQEDADRMMVDYGYVNTDFSNWGN